MSSEDWAVTLLRPLKIPGREDVAVLKLRPFTLHDTARATRGEFRSTLALLAEISNIPEPVLNGMTYPDVDRVMIAFMSLLPQGVKDNISTGKLPFFSPPEELTAEETYEHADQVDDVNPLFPKVGGPIKRFKSEDIRPPGQEPPPPSAKPAKQEEQLGSGFDMDTAAGIRKVG